MGSGLVRWRLGIQGGRGSRYASFSNIFPLAEPSTGLPSGMALTTPTWSLFSPTERNNCACAARLPQTLLPINTQLAPTEMNQAERQNSALAKAGAGGCAR